MDAVFLKVFNISVTACWLCLAVILLRFCLKKAPKGLICLLWAVVGLRLIFPFSLESVFSLIPSTETVPESIISGGTPPTANIGAPSVNMGAPNVNVGAPNVNGTVTPSAPVVTPPTAEPVDLMQVAVTVASYVWIAGVVLMLCYMAFSYLRVRLRVREAVPTEKGVWICDGVDTPFILGIVRPRIYLPSDLEEGDRQFVLAHERAHLRRGDHAWKPLGFLLLTVYWFQPLLWVAYVLLCRDIEFACDEKVLAEMGQDARRAYSSALVKCSVLRKQISACPVAFGETNVVSRVKRVMHYKKPGFWIVLIAVIAVIVTAVCFLTDPVSDREDDDPTEQETTGQETTGMGEEMTSTNEDITTSNEEGTTAEPFLDEIFSGSDTLNLFDTFGNIEGFFTVYRQNNSGTMVVVDPGNLDERVAGWVQCWTLFEADGLSNGVYENPRFYARITIPSHNSSAFYVIGASSYNLSNGVEFTEDDIASATWQMREDMNESSIGWDLVYDNISIFGMTFDADISEEDMNFLMQEFKKGLVLLKY